MPRLRLSHLQGAAVLLILAGLLAAAYLVNDSMRTEREEEAGSDAVQAPKRVEDHVVKLGRELAASHGVQHERARAILWTPRQLVYGRVVPNPRATVEIRAPFAGTLRADAATSWPTLGLHVRAGQVLGHVEIRVGPQQRLDFQAKLNEARLKQEGAKAILKIQQERVARLEKATGSETLSRRELDEAQVALAEARTQAATAKAAVGLWHKALEAVNRHKDGPADWSAPLTAADDGEVTEAVARPGTAVEAGGLIVRLVDFRRILVRLDLPADLLDTGPPARVALYAQAVPTGDGALDETGGANLGPPVVAARVGPAPQVDVASQRTGYWYEVNRGPSSRSGPAVVEGGWRPGRFVQAFLPAAAGQPRQAVAVPCTALLYHQGHAWVYVRTGAGQYRRRAVQVLGRDGDCCVLSAGVAAGEPVVICQAQVLLSEEFRSEAEAD